MNSLGMILIVIVSPHFGNIFTVHKVYKVLLFPWKPQFESSKIFLFDTEARLKFKHNEWYIVYLHDFKTISDVRQFYLY